MKDSVWGLTRKVCNQATAEPLKSRETWDFLFTDDSFMRWHFSKLHPITVTPLCPVKHLLQYLFIDAVILAHDEVMMKCSASISASHFICGAFGYLPSSVPPGRTSRTPSILHSVAVLYANKGMQICCLTANSVSPRRCYSDFMTLIKPCARTVCVSAVVDMWQGDRQQQREAL